MDKRPNEIPNPEGFAMRVVLEGLCENGDPAGGVSGQGKCPRTGGYRSLFAMPTHRIWLTSRRPLPL